MLPPPPRPANPGPSNAPSSLTGYGFADDNAFADIWDENNWHAVEEWKPPQAQIANPMEAHLAAPTHQEEELITAAQAKETMLLKTKLAAKLRAEQKAEMQA